MASPWLDFRGFAETIRPAARVWLQPPPPMLIRSRLALIEPRRARVEIIPLIDVVFFLMASFVLFTFTMDNTRSLGMTLPQGGNVTDRENVTLQISDGGTAYWNQERVNVSELPSRLAAYRKASADPR